MYQLSQFQSDLIEQLGKGPGVGTTLIKGKHSAEVSDLITLGFIRDDSSLLFSSDSKVQFLTPTPACITFALGVESFNQ